MSPERDAHVDPLEIVAYARGELAGKRGTLVGRHCHDCVVCGDQLAAVMLLRRRAGLGASRPRQRWLPVAAAAVLVLAAGLVWVTSRGGAPEVSEGLPAAVASRSADVENGVRAPEGEPVGSGDIDASPRTLRDDPLLRDTLQLLADDGQASLVAAGTTETEAKRVAEVVAVGDYAAAAELLGSAESEVPALLGIVRYMAGDPAGARAVLEPVIEPPSDSFEGRDFDRRLAAVTLAATYLELGELETLQRFLEGWHRPLPESRGRERLEQILDGIAARASVR